MADPPLPGITEPDPGSYDYTDPDQERQEKAKASLREDRIRATESAILSTPGGREWLWAILSTANVFELTEPGLAATGVSKMTLVNLSRV